MLRPLNDRVLIRPLKNEDETPSGLILPENRADTYAEMQGEVIGVGMCAHPRKAETEGLADAFEKHIARYTVAEYPEGDTKDRSLVYQARDLLRDLVRREPCVKIGDHVLFSWSAGQKVTIDDEELLLMREDDLLAVLED